MKTYTPIEILAISIEVYKMRLVQDSGEGAVERMLEKDNDGGMKLASRARAYNPLTRCYLIALGLHEPKKKQQQIDDEGTPDH